MCRFTQLICFILQEDFEALLSSGCLCLRPDFISAHLSNPEADVDDYCPQEIKALKAAYVYERLSLTLNAPISIKVVCFSNLLKCLGSLYSKQCGPRSDCSYKSSLFWVHTVCFYTQFVSNVRQLFAADQFSRQHFQMHFFLAHEGLKK